MKHNECKTCLNNYCKSRLDNNELLYNIMFYIVYVEFSFPDQLFPEALYISGVLVYHGGHLL